MPGYESVIDAPTGRKAIARATLRTPGDWKDQTEEQRRLFNEATRAINALLDLYVPPDWTCTAPECDRVNDYTKLFCDRCGSMKPDQP